MFTSSVTTSKGLLILAFLLLASLSVSPTVLRADEVYTFIVKKQEKKEQSRWSLAEWIKTRDKMRLMDLWLHLHSPSPYEFFLSGEYQFGEKSNGDQAQVFDLAFAAYASIFGLEVHYETSPLYRLTGIFNLRILGVHVQNTHLTLQGGLAQRKVRGGVARNPFAGAMLSLYFVKFFGIDGYYRYYFPSAASLDGPLKGYRTQGGPFIDFKMIRIFGNYFLEKTNHGAASHKTQGFTGGLKLFF